MLAAVALTACGTLLPFTLFAYGQSRVRAEVAGAFLNLEPLVGAIAGAVVFAIPAQLVTWSPLKASDIKSAMTSDYDRV